MRKALDVMVAHDKVESIIKSLFTCTTKDQIDNIFAKNEIIDFQQKIELLRRCMEVKSVYGTPEEISLEDEYDFECAVFVEGTWRMLN
ncbi:MAG: hypothetical protein P1P59_07160 [Treponemataceae bacterium]